MYLTAKELKEVLSKVNDDSIVYYQRIEDNYFSNLGWETEEIIWEQGEFSEYIKAFSAYIRTNNEGEECLIINAHY